jgi:hypothetical protein
MALGFCIKGEISNTTSVLQGKESCFNAITTYITNASCGLLADLLSFNEREHTLQVVIHPCEEAVTFDFTSDGVICTAKTSGVGPGYHAYVVDLIDALGQALSIQWHWNLQEENIFYQDETDYHHNQNYNHLQTEMIHWLKGLCQSFVDDGGDQYVISLPIGYPRFSFEYYAASPIKIWTRNWIHHTAFQEPDALQEAAKEFFVWWNREPDELFFKQTGIALLNVECPWHFPEDEDERRIYRLIDRCFTNAREINSSLTLPEEDWKSVKAFLKEEEVDIAETAYGYRKNTMTFNLAGEWMIDLPGNVYYAIDDATEIYYDDIRTVRNTCYTLAVKEKSEKDFAETFFNYDENVGAERFTSINSITGNAMIYYNVDQADDEDYWILQGVRIIGDSFILTSICYSDTDDKEWAIETWNTIRM